MNATFEQVTLEVAQALVTKATSQGLSVNDYLRGLLGMSNGTAAAELVVADTLPVVPPRNEALLKTIEEVEERMKDMPVRGSTEETLRMIRRARAGEMWGYEPEPTDYE